MPSPAFEGYSAGAWRAFRSSSARWPCAIRSSRPRVRSDTAWRCSTSSPPSLLGGLVSKTVTLKPRPGNPLPRICETEAGFLNSIGLENRGVEAYRRDVLPQMARAGTCVITNIGGEKVEEFEELARMLDGESAIARLRGQPLLSQRAGGQAALRHRPEDGRARDRDACAPRRRSPCFAKLSPNVSRLSELAIAVEAGRRARHHGRQHGAGHEDRLAHARAGPLHRAGRLLGRRDQAHRAALRLGVRAQRQDPGHGLRRDRLGRGRARVPRRRLQRRCRSGTASFSDPGLLARLPGELEALLDAERIADVRELIGSLRLPRAARGRQGRARPARGPGRRQRARGEPLAAAWARGAARSCAWRTSRPRTCAAPSRSTWRSPGPAWSSRARA